MTARTTRGTSPTTPAWRGPRTWTRTELAALRAQTLDQAGALPVGPPLTARQVQVLMLLAEGMTAAGIAAHLQVALKTAQTYRARLIDALGANNGPHAVHLAYQRGFLTVGDVDGRR